MDNILSHITKDDLLRPSTLVAIAAALCGAELARRILKLRAALAGIGNLPGRRTLCGPHTLLAAFLPQIPYINLPAGWQFKEKYRLHEQYGADVVSSAYLFDPDNIYLWIADAAIAKKITTITPKKVDFPKPIKMFEAICIYGGNIVAAEFDEWRRHRRIAGPSFSDRNNKVVHEETTRLTEDLLDRWSAKGARVVNIDNVVTFTSKLTVMIISIAGFGYSFGWDETEEMPPGHKMTFRTSLSTLLYNFPLRLLFSDSALMFSKTGRKVVTAFRELGVYMSEMIEERRQGGSAGEPDLFTNLINGTSEDPKERAENQLSNEELKGNIFTFLFGGHETTAHSLGFTLALLAMHPDIQEKAFQELRRIVPEGEAPTYAQILEWKYGLAVTHESLRMFPPILSLWRYSGHDTVLTTFSTDGRNTPITFPVPQGTKIMVSIAGLHYNPKYWDQPELFRPERFLGNYNKDAFMPWGAGPRSCIGRRFSETDSLTFLANLLLKYRFKVTPISDKETPAEMKERVLRWSHGMITIAPEKVPLTFTLRDK